MVDLNVLKGRGKSLAVEAVVLPKVTINVPSHPAPFSRKWKHLSNIRLADPDFGTPGSVDLLLGADVFSRTTLHGQRFGRSDSPSAFKTCFGWVGCLLVTPRAVVTAIDLTGRFSRLLVLSF